MTNKEKLKIAMEEDIASKDCYNKIIKKIECENQAKNNLWRLVPICLIIVISHLQVLVNKCYLFRN